MKSPRAIARRIESWFAASARELPWRTTQRDPWASLISELMLQQTQASRVAERFKKFLQRFPTPRAMVDAGESAVLAEWSGLGYYRRARLLHAAANAIVAQHGGQVPSDAAALRALPGVGRYTAGAVASMAFGLREPIVDANVARVLLRLEGAALPVADPAAQRLSWDNARSLVEACARPELLNEGLMELGALICTPRAPDCAQCPIRASCVARRERRQDEIPSPSTKAARKDVHHACVVVRDRAGRLLLQRRPSAGLWAGMWQPPSLEGDRAPTRSRLTSRLKLRAVSREGAFTHLTTHRAVRFSVWAGEGDGPDDARWLAPGDLDTIALSSPHRRILTGEWRTR